jgi:hypothetical protein
MDEIFQFEGYRLDRRGLFRRDDWSVFVPIPMGSRALDLLGGFVKFTSSVPVRVVPQAHIVWVSDGQSGTISRYGCLT